MVPDFEKRVAAAKKEIRARSFDGIQRRTFIAPVELREGEAGSWQISGTGIAYNVLSENLGGFREKIAAGAATKVLGTNPDVRGLINHNPDLILGRTTAGTMALSESQRGTHYLIDPPATTYANDLRVSMARGDINQSSFAFRVGEDDWEEDDTTGALIRTVIELSELYDMSPVTYPAYTATDSGIGFQQNSALTGERDGDGLTAEERAEDGNGKDTQADDATDWRLKAVQRRMKLRELA